MSASAVNKEGQQQAEQGGVGFDSLCIDGASLDNLNHDNLGAQLNTVLETRDIEHYDPVRFACLKSLLRRLSEPRHTSNSSLIEKINARLSEYTENFVKDREAAGLIVETISDAFPDQLPAAQALFASCKFTSLSQLSARLSRDSLTGEGLASLSELHLELTEQDQDEVDDEQLNSLEYLLEQQQQEARSLVGGLADSVVSTGSVLDTSTQPVQLSLRSMQVHRESTKRLNIDNIIAQAIDDGPENPGPHNPQMLAIESLIQMRELSPSYTRRFAAYIATLLWLENPGAKLGDKNRK
ncbi:DUF2894 domain-containing protein [Arenicella xantha]|uniref:DUF2894 family protein n=1 Tax=Arenicella xantha TaxID=644221 RepID=A0A395JJN5_9GAMM|nr:DUF2894 domain-containing protein [Arenicella xantha]RBP50729.1 DUF2894 family protein [Arenicella xantha]